MRPQAPGRGTAPSTAADAPAGPVPEERRTERDPGGGLGSLPFLDMPRPSALVQRNPPPLRGEGPKLRAGDLVGGQYRVEGCLARGGLGWIYLAEDERLDDHVALKGLIDSDDGRARRLMEAERRALVDLKHPNIVQIRNFVRHGRTDYIVMEYVSGRTLRQIGDGARAGGLPFGEPFRVGHVVSYGLEILEALGYLHGRGLLYCDMKPLNVMHTGSRVKLIDMGAVRRTEDRSSPVVGTPGYLVPKEEIREHGLTVRSDLFALGVTLRELLKAAQGDRPESLDRALARAAHEDFEERFASAAEMAEQLRGVLREILSLQDGRERPERSARFAPSPVLLDGGLGAVPPLRWWTEREAGPRDGASGLLEGIRPDPWTGATGLPAPRPDPADPEAGLLDAMDAADPGRLLAKLAQAPRPTAETELLRCRAHLCLADLGRAEKHLLEAESLTGGGRSPWSLLWHRGLLELARGNVSEARGHFDRVYSMLPGESAPKLALGFCEEHLGRPDRAERHYESVWRPDRSQASAVFGLARIRLSRRPRGEVVDALKDGTLFAVVAGTERARMVDPAKERMATAFRDTREGAKRAVQELDAYGRTSIHAWLAQARRLFAGTAAEIRHAVLLTDGRNHPVAEEELREEVGRCVGVFSCDPRGIGEDWDPRELRMIAAGLDGRAGAVAGPAGLEADFRAMAEAAMGRSVPSVRLRVRLLPGLRIRFLRKVYPSRSEPPCREVSADGRTVEYDLGAWGDEVREYLVCLTVGPDAPPRVKGEPIRLARLELLVPDAAGGAAGPGGAILVRWTDDPAEFTRLDPKVGHYTGQSELSELVNGGYDAYRREAYEEAALHWGRALGKAAAVGREELRERLGRLVLLDGKGAPRLRPGLRELDGKLAGLFSEQFSRALPEEE